MKKLTFFLFVLLGVGGLWCAGVQGANALNSEHYTEPKIKRFTINNSLQNEFLAYDKNFVGGARVATADFNGDGAAEIITGAGPGGGPHVKIFEPSGRLLYSFFPFHPDFRGGVNVAGGDVDGDGKAELIVAQASKGQAWVKIYKVQQNIVLANFMAYDPGHQGGAFVASGDIDGNGKDEVITSPATSARCHVRTFNQTGRFTGWDAFPFADRQKGGCAVASGNVDGGRESEVIVSIAAFDAATVRTYKTSADRRIVGEFVAYPRPYSNGVQITAGDFDNDGEDEVATIPTLGRTHVRFFEAYGQAFAQNFFAFSTGFTGGGFLAAIDLANGTTSVLTSPSRKIYTGRTDFYKYIEVDISEQRLRAYREGEEVFTTLVSTGIYRYPTPIGTFSVRDHVKSQRMTWEYGPDHPDNYDLANVPNVMHFYQGYALHGAYWHNNFGRRMSHGCINIPLGAAEWLYNWADNGDAVIVHE